MGLLIRLALLTLLYSCSPAYKKFVSNYKFDNSNKIPDYGNLNYWAANPEKKSTSDSIPAPLMASYRKDSSVDIFFLHPTTFGSREAEGWNANINDPDVNAKTDYTTILYQASAFNEYRVFAPRYRQANFQAYFSEDTVQKRVAFDLAYYDIKLAFTYYLNHYNKGRPIIIAAHSQGSTHAKRLLKEFFENTPLKSKLVVAYIIGMDVPKNYFSSLSPCKDSSSTGCFISWRTFRTGYEPEFVKEENGNSVATNPLTWTTGDEYAPSELNAGAVLRKFNQVIPGASDAQVHQGILWIHKPHFPGGIFYRSKNYHIADINLYYSNIRNNLRTRVASFWKN